MLWRDEQEQSERDKIIADLQNLIDDASQLEHKRAAYVRFGDLDQIATEVRAFKDALYKEVIARGGITQLSRLTGMPQLSVSRFFATASMPRRSTLIKFADALDAQRCSDRC